MRAWLRPPRGRRILKLVIGQLPHIDTVWYEGSRGQIQGAIDSLVKRAIKSGDIRKDLEPFDLLRALIDVSNVASSPDWQQSARRLVDILIIIIGSRPIR